MSSVLILPGQNSRTWNLIIKGPSHRLLSPNSLSVLLKWSRTLWSPLSTHPRPQPAFCLWKGFGLRISLIREVGTCRNEGKQSKECTCAQSCLTVCDPMDHSLPGSSAHGLFPGENTVVGYYALFQGDLLDPGIKPASPESPASAGGFFTTESPEKPNQGRPNNNILIKHTQGLLVPSQGLWVIL